MVQENFAAQARAVDVYIYFGGGDALMAEHLLDGAEVGAPLEEVGGEGVAEGVGRDCLSYAGAVGEPPYYSEYHLACEPASATAEEKDAFLAGLHDSTGALFEVRAYCSHGDVAHRHKALLGALAGDYEIRVVEVEPGDFEVYQLGHAEPAAVESLDDGAVAHGLRRLGVDGCYEGVDFVDCEHFWEMEPGARGLQQKGGIGVYVAVVRKESEEGFYAADNASLRARGDAEVMKVGAISAEVADGDLRQGYGKLVEPREEARHITEICLAGVVAEPALKGQV